MLAPSPLPSAASFPRRAELWAFLIGLCQTPAEAALGFSRSARGRLRSALGRLPFHSHSLLVGLPVGPRSRPSLTVLSALEAAVLRVQQFERVSTIFSAAPKSPLPAMKCFFRFPIASAGRRSPTDPGRCVGRGGFVHSCCQAQKTKKLKNSKTPNLIQTREKTKNLRQPYRDQRACAHVRRGKRQSEL